MKNTFGSAVTLTLFGESHGPAVGVVIDGLAPGLPVDEAAIDAEMQKRRATSAIATGRQEADVVEFLSGVHEGHTTGTSLCLIVRNTNTRSGDYTRTAHLLRPSHADYTAEVKYHGFQDIRGGGHFSARLTAPLVAAGALFRGILAGHGITVGSHISRCANINDIPLPREEHALTEALAALNKMQFAVLDEVAGAKMQEAILAAKGDLDSVGGVIETAVTGMPAGIGEPFFGSVESVLAALLYSIPAVKGVAFGLGATLAGMRGSAANDDFVLEDGKVRTATNNNGGINGGITNGMPLLLHTAFKPTPSIAQAQKTVDIDSMQEAVLELKGRHDPCVVPRARAAVDAMVCFGLVDLLTVARGTDWQAAGRNT